MLVNGIHHVCIKCRMDQVKKVKEFYTEVLGLPAVRSWGEPELAGFVFDSGAGLIEVFTNAQEDLPHIFERFRRERKRTVFLFHVD